MDRPAATSPKEKIINFALGLVPELLTDGLRGDHGGTSHLLLGPKGIGKTNTLRSLSVCLSLMHPDLIVIYIDYLNNAPAPSAHLREALLRRIPEASFPDDSLRVPMDVLMEQYAHYDLKALVIVDELDQVYRRDDNEHGRQILDELAFLGSNPHGSNVVIACGSSAVLPQLISRNGSHHETIREEYPLVKQCANLNGTKFPSFRVEE
mmetsp:Transcript_7068/g.26473  ORF Transcript_7068/g.26473 Transcript_7068/m.26473 type:complete len:208 (+) Transcript_7068:2494-3117(+)